LTETSNHRLCGEEKRDERQAVPHRKQQPIEQSGSPESDRDSFFPCFPFLRERVWLSEIRHRVNGNVIAIDGKVQMVAGGASRGADFGNHLTGFDSLSH